MTALEFGIIAAPFLGLLFAILEVSILMFDAEMLENVTADAARQLMTGTIQSGSGDIDSQKAAFENLICPKDANVARPASALPGNFDCKDVAIDVRSAKDLSAAQSASTSGDLNLFNNGATSFSPAKSGEISVVRVMYAAPVYVSVLSVNSKGAAQNNTTGSSIVKGQWRRVITAVAVFKTEPY